jgi:hypothetical protein
MFVLRKKIGGVSAFSKVPFRLTFCFVIPSNNK